MSIKLSFSDASGLIHLTLSMVTDSDEEDEYFEEDYEDSFIDDDGEVGDRPSPGSDLDVAPLPFFVGDDEDDGDEEVAEVDSSLVGARNRQAPIVISSDEEGDDYADADVHVDYGRSWDGEDEGDYHDARSGSEDHVEPEFWSDDDPCDNPSCDFYGYL